MYPALGIDKFPIVVDEGEDSVVGVSRPVSGPSYLTMDPLLSVSGPSYLTIEPRLAASASSSSCL